LETGPPLTGLSLKLLLLLLLLLLLKLKLLLELSLSKEFCLVLLCLDRLRGRFRIRRMCREKKENWPESSSSRTEASASAFGPGAPCWERSQG